MKLLVLTQSVDAKDPVLGFFHRSLLELAGRVEEIIVITLYVGKHSLPENVRVYSLGKERGTSRMTRVLRLLRYIIVLRKEYDAVFVHMNEEYVVLGGVLWKLFGKKIYLWRNHYAGSFLTAVAARLSTNVFYTSKDSYTAHFANALSMPVGIDLELFKPNPSLTPAPHSILSLGRIAPSKHIHVLIEAMRQLDASYTLDLYGDALPKDRNYAARLVSRSRELGLDTRVRFYSSIPNGETPAVYAAHALFANLSPGGMFDKTLLEALACGCRVVSTSPDFARELHTDAVRLDVTEIAEAIRRHSEEPIPSEAQALLARHSLEAWGQKLGRAMGF